MTLFKLFSHDHDVTIGAILFHFPAGKQNGVTS